MEEGHPENDPRDLAPRYATVDTSVLGWHVWIVPFASTSNYIPETPFSAHLRSLARDKADAEGPATP